MKRCPACNRTYPDDTLTFCLEDGTPLVRATGAYYEPAQQQQPTVSFQQTTDQQPAPAVKKQSVAGIILGVLALGLGLSALLSAFYAWKWSALDGSQTFGYAALGLGIFALLLSFVAMIMIKRIAKLLGLAGLLLSLVAVGAGFMTAFVAGPNSLFDRMTSTKTDQETPPVPTPSSTAPPSNKSDVSTSTTTEEEKYRLFYAASQTGDQDLILRVSKKVGIIGEDNNPTPAYESFVDGMFQWALKDTEFIQKMDTKEKARVYVKEHL